MSGSSVPEAARAAKWARAIATAADADACFDEPYEQDGSTSDQDDRDYFHRLATQVMAEADREIAAAVAEERATTGRRIEEALAGAGSVSCAGMTVDADGCFAADVATRVRAALASPGEGEQAWVPICPHCGNELEGHESLKASRAILAEHLRDRHADVPAPTFGEPMTVAQWRREQRSRPYNDDTRLRAASPGEET